MLHLATNSTKCGNILSDNAGCVRLRSIYQVPYPLKNVEGTALSQEGIELFHVDDSFLLGVLDEGDRYHR